MTEPAKTKEHLESLVLAPRAELSARRAAYPGGSTGVLAVLLAVMAVVSLPLVLPRLGQREAARPFLPESHDGAARGAAASVRADRGVAETSGAAARRREAEAALSATGFVVPASGVIELAARTSGQVAEVRVSPGQRVAAGELLLRLDDRAARAALAQVSARLSSALAERAFARARRGRAERLRAAGLLSREEWEREASRAALVEAQVQEHEAALERHLLELELTELRAPRAGVVLEVRREVGEVVFPAAPEGNPWLLALADLGDLRVAVDVHEADLPQLALDQPATVAVDALPGRSYAARVVTIGARANRQKGTVAVEVAILAPDRHLRPDASARVRFLPFPIER